jgi:hypothetical protein
MSSTGIDISLEVYGATVMRYFTGMAVALVLYDCLLTLDDEVRVASSFCYVTSFRLPQNHRSALFGRHPFTGRQPSTTLIAIYPSAS